MLQMQSRQQNFVYIDSSQQEDNCKGAFGFQQKFSQSNLSYHDSSSSDLQNIFQSIDQNSNQTNQPNQSQINRLCKIRSDKFLLKDNYIHTVERIIRENQQKLSKKTPLLLAETDKQILQNLQKRKKNYGFFLRTLQIDKHYNQILSKKVSKIKQQNQRKKQVLLKKRQKQTIQQDQDQIKKYILDKKTKEQIIIDKIQKHAYRLGIERIRAQEKHTKSQIKQIDQANFLKTVNLDMKQRNQIYQLREQLQKIRGINRINKVEQSKVLKDLQKSIVDTKKALVSKAQIAQLNKFII